MHRKSSATKLVSSQPQWRIFTLSALTAFVSFTAGGVLVSGGIAAGTSQVAAVTTAKDLGLNKINKCDERKITKFKSPGSGKTYDVYKLDGTWHDSNGCMLDLLNAAGEQKIGDPIFTFAYYQMLYILSLPEVRFGDGTGKGQLTLKDVLDKNDELVHRKIQRVMWVGNEGDPHDAMVQSDLGGWAMNMYRLTEKKEGANQKQVAGYKTTAFGAMDTVIAPVGGSGLESRSTCQKKTTEKCSFFHSKTNPNVEVEKAWTMNKHVYAVNNLWWFGKDLEKVSDANLKSKADQYKKAAIEGMHQLVYGESVKTGKAPSLFDYVPMNNGKAIQNSWIYYSMDTDTRKGFYLDGAGKNCGYHQLIVSLLARNFKDMSGEIKMQGFTEKRDNLGNKSILEYLVRSYELKKEDGLYKKSKTENGGNFDACENDGGAEISKEEMKFLRSL